MALAWSTSAKALEAARRRSHGFAVVKLQEALDLRDAGHQEAGAADGAGRRARPAAARWRADIMPMVYTPIGDLLEREAARLGRAIPIHVCIDTGIGRVGVPHTASRRPDPRPGRRARASSIDGTMMTFTEDLAFDREQTQRFTALTTELKSARASSSAGCTRHRPTRCFNTATRRTSTWCASAWRLLGIYPDPKFKAHEHPRPANRARVARARRVREAARRRRPARATSAPTWRRKIRGSPRCPSATPMAGRAWPPRAARVRINGRDVSGDRIGVGEPHDRRDRRHAGREGRRCRDAVRLGRRVAARGRGRRDAAHRSTT